jgi:hypothetical protein
VGADRPEHSPVFAGYDFGAIQLRLGVFDHQIFTGQGSFAAG